LLFLADRAKQTEGKVSPVKAIIVGIAQAIAILPGISRSGATIGTSVLLGIDRTRAARFSFLMVVPLIFGAMAVKTKNYLEVQGVNKIEVPAKQADYIIDELKEDYPFIDSKQVKTAITIKETEANAISKGDYSLRDVELNYAKNLILAGLSADQIETLLTDDLAKVRPVTKTSSLTLLAGFLAAFITGLFACTWMISIVKKSKLSYFAYYCFIVGSLSIAWNLLA